MKQTTIKPGGKLAWATLIILILLYCSDFVVRMIWSVSMEAIKNDFNFSDTEIGMLQSVFFIGLGIFTVPVALLVDRWSRKKTISLMAIFWSLGTFATALSGNFIAMFSSRFATGVGVAGFAPAAFSWVSDIFPQKKRATAIGLLYVGMIIGAILGMGLGGYMITQTGDWKIVYYAFGAPGLILAILILFFPDPLSKERANSNQSAIFADLKELSRIKTYKTTIVAAGFYTILGIAAQTWIVVLMMRAYSLNEAKAGAIMGAMILPALLAPVLGGFIADRMQKKSPHGRPLFCATYGVIGVIFYALLFVLAGKVSLMAFVGINLVISLFSGAIPPVYNTIVQDVVPPAKRSSGAGILIFAQYIIFTWWASTLVGSISDYLGGGVFGLRMALLAMCPFTLLALWFFYKSTKTYAADAEKYAEVEPAADAGAVAQ